jgi:hypothetical protein
MPVRTERRIVKLRVAGRLGLNPSTVRRVRVRVRVRVWVRYGCPPLAHLDPPAASPTSQDRTTSAS